MAFYLQASKYNQGMFFGFFKAETIGFFDENDNYLRAELGRDLSFRILLSPDCVYPQGITEHDLLDDLSGKEAPYELCWSLIYRKLKGNRGCTMITQYEYEELNKKLFQKNKGQTLTAKFLSFNLKESKIIPIEEEHPYQGRRDNLSIKPRLLNKAHKGNAFEAHLQAFVMQEFDSVLLKDKLLTLDNNSAWVGNEVSCGVGMQSIDAMIIEENDQEIHIKIIEMKYKEPYPDIVDRQLPWYLKWTSQYMIPNFLKSGKKVIIHPCILASKTNNQKMIEKIRRDQLISLNIENVTVEPTEFIGFEVSDTDISFEKIV